MLSASVLVKPKHKSGSDQRQHLKDLPIPIQVKASMRPARLELQLFSGHAQLYNEGDDSILLVVGSTVTCTGVLYNEANQRLDG
mmetsp:Transcript_12783/g.18340  ORF Transcript_12783/g.18340 Transcript_12783/m.18340 type:complete len:84 (-) Transcript_12783:14-265(-)